MYAHKTRKNKANLYKTDKKTYAVNLPTAIAREIFGKRRKRIALYLSADSSESTAKALQHESKIQALIDAQDWQGLLKYEENLKPKVIKGNFAKRTLKELWDSYTEEHWKKWQHSYKENDVKYATKILEKFPDIGANDDFNPMYEHLLKTTTAKQAKRYLKQFSACLNYHKKIKRVEHNPFPDFIRALPLKKRDKNKLDINPFTKEERDLIIDAFRTGKFDRYRNKHTRYADYVEFNFLTGARTSETLGLKWKHIDFKNRKIHFKEAKVLATNGGKGTSVQKKGLKTQDDRIIPINNRILNLLLERKKTLNPINLEANVFEDINHNSFRSGAYTYVLKKLGIEYRSPYQTRHTFITIMANYSGLPLHQIAIICGTSVKVIEEHYLGKSLDIESLPEI